MVAPLAIKKGAGDRNLRQGWSQVGKAGFGCDLSCYSIHLMKATHRSTLEVLDLWPQGGTSVNIC